MELPKNIKKWQTPQHHSIKRYKSLLDLECIEQVLGSSGRNIRYEIVVMAKSLWVKTIDC